MNTDNRAKNPTVFIASYDREQDAFRLSMVEESKPDVRERQTESGQGRPAKSIRIEFC